MKKIYLILAHKSPDQLERQIRALDDEDSTFYVHVDLKSNFNLFTRINKLKNVTLINERVDSGWGDFSIIIATINLIENALKNHSEGICILMSGSDFPIKSLLQVNSFLLKNKDKIFIDLHEAGSVWENFNKRITDYRINKGSDKDNFLLLKGFNLKTLFHFLLGNITRRQFLKIAFKKRKLNLNMKFYGGSQWWSMGVSDLIKVNDFIQNNRDELFNFFADSHIPDEFFFHSIIMHLKSLGHKIAIEDSLTYVNWTRENCQLPVTFEANDLQELMDQPPGKLFARKFDIEIERQILDNIDEKILKHKNLEINKIVS